MPLILINQENIISSFRFSILCHFIQFGSHGSWAPSKYSNVTVIMASKMDMLKIFSVTDLYA